jgi:atlastin
MYKKPFIRTLPNGKKVAVLLVDTQGTFDNNTRQEMNAIIFALNSLLSSVQVYNVSKRIGEVSFAARDELLAALA